MESRGITERTTLVELGAVVSEALRAAGIVATLSGGAAVSIYSDGRYESQDLDFVTTALLDELERVLEPLGFEHTGRGRLSVFEHPETRWYLEFPPAPLAFGGTYIDASKCDVLETVVGELRIISPTHSVMDRLIAAAAWGDPQALAQAVLVATHQAGRINWVEVDRWIVAEGIADAGETRGFYSSIDRPLPRQ